MPVPARNPLKDTMLTWKQQTPVLSKPSHDIKAVFTLVCAYSSRQKSSSKPSIWKKYFGFCFLLIFKTYLCNVASIQLTLSNGFVPKVNITPLLHQETTSALWCQQANNVCNNVMQNKMLYVWWYDHMMFYGIPWFFVLWEEVCATTYVHKGWSQLLKILSVLTQLVLVCLYQA